jgi:hypothetical protein
MWRTMVNVLRDGCSLEDSLQVDSCWFSSEDWLPNQSRPTIVFEDIRIFTSHKRVSAQTWSSIPSYKTPLEIYLKIIKIQFHTGLIKMYVYTAIVHVYEQNYKCTLVQYVVPG